MFYCCRQNSGPAKLVHIQYFGGRFSNVAGLFDSVTLCATQAGLVSLDN
jgi:hypothetical protein